MRTSIISLLAKQVVKDAFINKAMLALSSIILLLLVYAAISGYSIYQKETTSRVYFQKEVRQHWEAMPDKHPHRMAHYGYIVFREKQPLSFFDFGLESYTGNAIFLEAHRQNTANFSEAGFSTGLLRFGEISMAMVLQVLVPLVIFFIGFGVVAADRENGTLKLLLTQGASWKEILIGKSLGLTVVGWSFLLPALLLLAGELLLMNAGNAAPQLGLIAVTYALYFAIVSTIAVLVSAVSKQAKTALVGLIGIWLLLSVLLPRTTQAIGSYLFPSPSKIAFETAVEADLVQQGDSHDPNDAHYKKLKDSILKANNVAATSDLSFNWSGFQMKEGERISSQLYNEHLQGLLQRYRQQNNLSRAAAFFNPFAAVRNLSMAVSGTDFQSFTRYQQQAEAYRYGLAQHMNDLQIQLVSNQKLADTAHPYNISKAYWKSFPDFRYQPLPLQTALGNESLSIAALLFWSVLLAGLVQISSQKLKAI